MKPLILLTILTLLTGCATAHKETLPPQLMYQPPSSGQTATIQGSMKPRYAKLVGDRIAYIVNIDGKRLPLEKKQQYKNLWDKSYPISTGEHTLTVQYNMAGWYTLPVKISFNAQANHDYQLDFATDIGTSLNSGNSYTDFWITDKATNKPISEVVRAQPVPDRPSYSVPIIIHNTPNVTIRH